MHSSPLPESAGTFRDDWKPTRAERPSFKCRGCGSHEVYYRTWESSDGAYEDVKYECRACGKVWWMEGDDG